jgi:hypothetical protein
LVNVQGHTPPNMPPPQWHCTHSTVRQVRPISSLLLLIECCIHQERLNELTCTMLEKWNKLGFSYPQFVTPCISVCLFFIRFQHCESNPCDFQICWRSCLYFLWYWDKILSAISTSTKLTVFIRFSTWNTSFVSKFDSTFSKIRNFHFTSDIRLCICNYFWHYIKTNATKHIFVFIPLTAVGTIKSEFWLSNAQRV